ncbi:glycosyl transferase family 2 [Pseudonocardia hierapolitana]|uniref:Glycosyl transferase family 2 n=1 Tax=Pseudonocardia hierapolitana TaxID=1128676 RepID=A0A561SVY0_9PSEU|nr:glycosyl transferase family 2 [Pseudonocardia hierapolitana]
MSNDVIGKPHVTVIMPIRNEERFIARSLGAVLGQHYPPDRMQVLVADGMSEDSTRAVVEDLARTHPQHVVRIVDNPGRIVPTGFNAALALADGDVIVRVDGHTVIEPDYVAECVRALDRSGADNVGGRMAAVGDGLVAQAIALATSSPFGVGNSHFHYVRGEKWVDTVYMGAWPRSVFDRIGPFDAELVRNQDDEFNYRLRSEGGRILLTDRIRSVYYSRSSLRTVFRQYRQYGMWKVRVLQKHPRQMSARQFVPPAFAATLLAGTVLTPASGAARRGLLATIVAYGLAAGAASVSIAREHGWRHLPVLPAVFAALHVGYGMGFLGGLVKFRTRWTRPRDGTRRSRGSRGN